MQTFSPENWLKIDIASNFGLEKQTWEDRVDWVDENEAILEDFVEKADNPAMFYAGVEAYRKTQDGQAIGYPISLDATASGAQILSVLVGCKKSAELCNVVDTGNREDFYTNIYSAMNHSSLKREDVKQAIMTALYSSTAVPKQVFGEGELLNHFHDTMTREAPGIWELNLAMNMLWQPDALKHEWTLPDNFHVKAKINDMETTQISFLERKYDVTTAVNRPMKEGRSLGANITHSVDGMIVREIGRRCNFQTSLSRLELISVLEENLKQTKAFVNSSGRKGFESLNEKMVKQLSQHYSESGFLSARIFDYIDAHSIVYAPQSALYDLFESLPARTFPVLMVHDCFRVHPNYADDLRKQYNQILFELSQSDVLAFLACQITGKPIKVIKQNTLGSEILDANYALS